MHDFGLSPLPGWDTKRARIDAERAGPGQVAWLEPPEREPVLVCAHDRLRGVCCESAQVLLINCVMMCNPAPSAEGSQHGVPCDGPQH